MASEESLNVLVIANPAFVTRYGYIRQHLGDRGIVAPIFVGLVGTDIIASGATVIENKSLSAGQIGCALSHVAAYDWMVTNGLGKAVIVEDDAILPMNFSKICHTLFAMLRKGELISLHSPTMQQRQLSGIGAEMVGNSQVVTPLEVRAVRSTLCYVVEIEAARRLADANRSVQHVADDFVSFYHLGCLKFVRIATPSLVSVEPFQSTIGYIKPGSLKYVLSRLMNATPGARDLLRFRRRKLRSQREVNHILVDSPSPLSEPNPHYVE